MSTRYLTKSKFLLAMECPTKLYYADRPEYSNLKIEDTFLQALAESGFQVLGLARAYYPTGVNLEILDLESAIVETSNLLGKDKVVIFEGAIRFENLAVRADILIKDHDRLNIIEVKSKSISSDDYFFTKKGPKAIKKDWDKYIFDAAFQEYVVSKAFPNLGVLTNLMLVNKDSTAPSDGLNQKFHVKKDANGKAKIIISKDITPQDLAEKILKKIDISDEIAFVTNEMRFRDSMSFTQYVNFLSAQYAADIKITPVLGSFCKKCEFKAQDEANSTLKNGFLECWSEVCGLQKNEASVLDIWNFRGADKLIETGVYKMAQVDEDDISPKPDDKLGMSQSERQWIQVKKVLEKDPSVYVDFDNLKDEMSSWVYPLHCIDFETAMPAIPFNKGEHPCSGIAFQFSHHILNEDGTVEHASQFIDDQIGQNPNLNFIRALKSSLSGTQGTIFRYSNHENTYLNMIHTQLKSSDTSIPDKDDLLSFIEEISQPTKDKFPKWKPGPRNMVDLWELVKRFYYDPLTGGSNSIKKVFPAILSRSSFLQDKYSQPIYGSANGIESLNFKDWIWVQTRDGKIVDPYELLPKLFDDIDLKDEKLDFLFSSEELREGGSASIAYARMQFTEMSDLERGELKKALLKYCELDTLAMVMIIEAWRDMLY